jgi:hypothetical protein
MFTHNHSASTPTCLSFINIIWVLLVMDSRRASPLTTMTRPTSLKFEAIMVDVIYRPNPLPIEQIKKLPELECLFPIPENYEEILEDVQQRGKQEPLVVNPENVLVCGFTRLQIAADLGLTEVPVRVIPHTDILDLKEYAIRDNFHRRQLTKLQLVELCGIPLEQIEAERARLRMQSGRTVDPVENVATGSPGKTRDKVGDFLGMSGRSYSSYRKIALKGSRLC